MHVVIYEDIERVIHTTVEVSETLSKLTNMDAEVREFSLFLYTIYKKETTIHKYFLTHLFHIFCTFNDVGAER